jgi:hypothetical protein
MAQVVECCLASIRQSTAKRERKTDRETGRQRVRETETERDP